jgi:uncharacterized membrane protein YbhN (UPF0104 family)
MWAGAAGVLFWIFKKVPPGEAIAALQQVRPLFFASVIVVFSMLTLLLDSMTHFWLFNRFNPPADFRAVLRARGESWLLLSLGALYGQGGMAWLMSRRTGKPLAEVTGSLLFLMFTSFLALIVISSVSLVFFIDRAAASGFRSSPECKIVSRFLLICWPVGIAFILFWIKDWDNPLRRRLKQGVHTAFDRARARDYLTAFALRALQFVLWACFSWAALRAALISISLPELFILGPIIGLISAIPTPGRLGTSQGAWLLLFQHGADPASLIAFSLLWTISTNLVRWLFGAFFLLSRIFSGRGS